MLLMGAEHEGNRFVRGELDDRSLSFNFVQGITHNLIIKGITFLQYAIDKYVSTKCFGRSFYTR